MNQLQLYTDFQIIKNVQINKTAQNLSFPILSYIEANEIVAVLFQFRIWS